MEGYHQRSPGRAAASQKPLEQSVGPKNMEPRYVNLNINMAEAAPRIRRLRSLAAAAVSPAASRILCSGLGGDDAVAERGLDLTPLSEILDRPSISFGAEVSGVDLRELADHGVGCDELYAAVVRHGVLIFRDQTLTEDQEIKLAQAFPHNSEFRPPALEYLGNTDKHGNRLERFVRGGRYWHVDGSQNALPMVVTWISAAERASVKCGGSSTLFASGVRALELLGPAERELALSLAVRYSTRDPHTHERAGVEAGPGTDRNSGAPALSPLLRNHDLEHGYDWLCNPLVRHHPETGRPSLWPSPGDMECLEDIETAEAMTPEESSRLLQQLLAPGTQDEHVYAHEWKVGDVVCWDNRSMLHSTESYDYDHASRHMHLASMKGPPSQGSPDVGRIPLRVGPVIAGLPEIRKLWWGEEDPRQYVMGSRGKVQTFASKQNE